MVIISRESSLPYALHCIAVAVPEHKHNVHISRQLLFLETFQKTPESLAGLVQKKRHSAKVC